MRKSFIVFVFVLLSSGTVFSQEKSIVEDTLKLKEVLIIDYKQGSSSNGYKYDTTNIATLGKISIKEIPFSVNIISSELIENSGAHNLSDVIKKNPTVASTLASNTDERGLDNTIIRGFEPHYYLDGLAINLYHLPKTHNIERVEFLNGLNGFFYGFSNYGGSVNFISKQPKKNQSASIVFGNYNLGVYYLNGDITGSIDKNQKLYYRMNGYLENGNTYIKDQKTQSAVFSGSLYYDVVKNTTIHVEAYRQFSLIEGQQNVFTVNPASNIFVPDAKIFNPRIQYGQPWTYSDNTLTQVGGGIKSKLNKTFSFRGLYRYGDGWWKYNFITSSFTDSLYNYKATDKDYSPQQRYYHSAYALIDVNVELFKMKHEITTGYVGNTAQIIFGGNPTASYNLGSYSLNNQVNVGTPSGIDTLVHASNLNNRYWWNSFLLSDRITINKYFSAIIGLNQAIYRTERATGNMTQDYAASYTQKKVSPMLSLVFKPIENLSVYASYIEGIGTGGIAPDVAKNAGDMLQPSTNSQYEAGIKTSYKKLNLYVAGFNITKINEYLDPSDSLYKQDGRQIHKGIELTLSGKAFKWLNIGGGFTILNAAVKLAENNPDIEGKTPQNVPEKIASTYIELIVPKVKGLSISASCNYIGERPVDAKNLDFIPSVITFDCGIHYIVLTEKAHKISVNLNLSNITDITYFASYTSSGLRLGAPRLLSLSLKYDI